MAEPLSTPGLFGELFEDTDLAEALSDRRLLQAMLDFEAALARAQAQAGLVPATAASAIASSCHAGHFDMAEIGRRTTLAGNPAIPLVTLLTAKVRAIDPAAAEFVHYGATSQDVIDSALAAVTEDALAIIAARLRDTCDRLAALARDHRGTVMAGRTLLQHALPISFGLKCALWLEQLAQARARLAGLAPPPLQFGGATGTLAALGEAGIAVHDALRDAWRGPMRPDRGDVPWHSGRGHPQRIAAEAGILVAALGKIARDIALLMQTEVAEVFEPSAPGKGGSSTLPHKRNPVQSLAIVAIATRTPGLVATMLSAGLQEHERGVGGWHAEWDTTRQLLALAGAACRHMNLLLAGLEIDAARMRANLDMTGGLIMAERIAFALAPSVGKAKAKALMEAACGRAVAEGRHLSAVLAEMPEAAALALDALFDPATYLGSSDAFIDRILAHAGGGGGNDTGGETR